MTHVYKYNMQIYSAYCAYGMLLFQQEEKYVQKVALQTSLLISDNLAGISPVPAGTGINLQIPAGTKFRYISNKII